jgi:hypothetical protein
MIIYRVVYAVDGISNAHTAMLANIPLNAKVFTARYKA